MPWTSEQLRAIEERGNLIVSAAAGAGKTAVLTERICARIIDQTPVERMLVLTFTRAAAAEMKERIQRRLADLTDAEHDPERRQYLRAQSRSVGSAHISTVHAFCARVLRRHYHAIGLAPSARVADEMEAAALTEQVKDAVLTALSAEENADWLRLLRAFGGESGAWDAVSELYRFLQAQPDPAGWLESAAARYDGQAEIDAQLCGVLDFCRQELGLVIDALTEVRDGLPPDMAGVIGVLDDELMRYRALLLCRDYDAYRQGVLDMDYQTLRFPRGTPDEEKTPVKEAREAGKKLIREQRARLFRPLDGERAAMADAGVALYALRTVTGVFSEAYAEAKRARGVLDYNDLEHMTLAALAIPEIAAEYRERFELIFVDEYQDSNRVQEAILSAIARPDNLFFVGDVKQSIYRFRQAEPSLFLEKLSAYDGSAGRRIDLQHNFRSAPEVLAAVNDTFSAIMSGQAGELDYDRRAMLVAGRPQQGGGAELHLIGKADRTEDDALETAADAEVEARLMAARIAELMETAPYTDPDTGASRALNYADFAILLRSTTHAQLIAQTLSQCGIPCYAQSGGGYFDAVEVQVFLNLLRVIDNRRQDVPLISVMRASIGDFSADELMRMRLLRRDGTFFDAVQALAGPDGAAESTLAEKVRAFLAMLARYREESRLVGMETLIGMLLDETGFYEEMGASYGGAQRQENLNALLSKAHAFEQSGERGLSGFLRQMDLARNSASFGTAQTAGADVVRMMTIHRSKGLEFPVTFLCQLGARFNTSAASAYLQLHAQDGVGLKYIDGARGVVRDTAVRRTIEKRLRREQLAEEMRVLYVGMTRAKNRLVLVGCTADPEEKLAAAQVAPSPLAVLQCASPLSWLLMGKRSALSVATYARSTFLTERPAEQATRMPPSDPAVVAALQARFAWRYPYADAVALPAKVAVSDAAAAAETDGAPDVSLASGSGLFETKRTPPAFEPPAFVRGERPSPARVGTAVHAALACLPLDGSVTAANLGRALEALRAEGRISDEQAALANPDAIAWFLETDLYAQMQKSPRVERELAFGYEMDAGALFDTAAEERVLLQGVIDCCFLRADGGWTLLDYKTDFILPGVPPEQAAERHRRQIELYAVALEHLSGLPVKACCIVFTSARAIVRL